MRKILVAAWLFVLLIVVGLLLWYNEYQYSLPTPVPPNYRPVENGRQIFLNDGLKFNNDKPVFIHFFNPDCPCSRFNITHFKTLVATYGNLVNFAVVIMSKRQYRPADFENKYNLYHIPVMNDAGIAAQCGVYSTPQAVIITPQHRLYYRGNYNRSRYCTDEKTEYAKMALQGFLSHQIPQKFSLFALRAYGCQLPNCSR